MDIDRPLVTHDTCLSRLGRMSRPRIHISAKPGFGADVCETVRCGLCETAAADTGLDIRRTTGTGANSIRCPLRRTLGRVDTSSCSVHAEIVIAITTTTTTTKVLRCDSRIFHVHELGGGGI